MWPDILFLKNPLIFGTLSVSEGARSAFFKFSPLFLCHASQWHRWPHPSLGGRHRPKQIWRRRRPRPVPPSAPGVAPLRVRFTQFASTVQNRRPSIVFRTAQMVTLWLWLVRVGVWRSGAAWLTTANAKVKTVAMDMAAPMAASAVNCASRVSAACLRREQRRA